MTVAQSLAPIIIFWAIIGGLGASLLLPAMQSLIHGNFEGAAQKKAYALVGAVGGDRRGGRAAARRLRDDVPIVACRLPARGRRHRRSSCRGIRLVRDVPYTGDRHIDAIGALLSVLGMGGVVLGILVWQEGGEAVVLLIVLGASRSAFARGS